MRVSTEHLSGFARLVCAVALGCAGATKTVGPYAFLSEVYAYQIAGPSVGIFLAAFLPWFEITLAVSLLVRHTARTALALSACCFGAFGLAQLWAVSRGLEIACGCFGTDRAVSPLTAALVMALCVLALGGFAIESRARRSRPEADEASWAAPAS